jgi:DNA-binding NarL/FixJ family response regulator
VEAHLTRLYERYDIRSRTELAARAASEGWLDIPPNES